MKKVLIILVLSALTIGYSDARDYTKLQVKEMKHAQKYNTAKKIFKANEINVTQNMTANYNIKDPKIMKFGHYDKITDSQYSTKMKQDEKKYEENRKALSKTASKHYKTQADAADFYRLYRIADKLIRANNLDYINWRIEIYKDTVSPNAYTTNTNYIAVSTSLIDNFGDNEDAIAMVLGHEMGHALLGHQQRLYKTNKYMQSQVQQAQKGNIYSMALYAGFKQKYRIESKNMEYAADVEGAKLALHAGYSLNGISDVMSYYNTLPRRKDWATDHPDPINRIQNVNQNAKYFPEEWKDMGRVRIYNSNVLSARLSSDRKSMVISAPVEKLNADKYYAPETMDELYARLGYMCYLNREFEKSVKYFDELFKIDQTNAPAYLYASYASEYLYKNTNDNKYLKLAKEYAQKAYSLDSKNKYIKEQVDSL